MFVRARLALATSSSFGFRMDVILTPTRGRSHADLGHSLESVVSIVSGGDWRLAIGHWRLGVGDCAGVLAPLTSFPRKRESCFLFFFASLRESTAAFFTR